MGRSPMVLAQTSVEEGIKAARMAFPRCYFDSKKTQRLLECLKRYRRDIHAKTGEPTVPLHDEYSHGADAFRYLGQAVERMKTSSTEYAEPHRPTGAPDPEAHHATIQTPRRRRPWRTHNPARVR
jgi:phage terminase large subunit